VAVILAACRPDAKQGNNRVRNSQPPSHSPGDRSTGPRVIRRTDKEVAMSGIWLKHLGRIAAVLVVATIVTMTVGTAAEARNDCYWGDPYYHYHHPWAYRDWGYPAYYAPRYYYRAPVYAYEPTYYPPAINFTIPLR